MRSYVIFAVFAVASFIAAGIFSSDVSSVESKNLPITGGEVGPLVVKEKNSVYEITIINRVKINDWSTVEVEMRDEHQKRLFSFSEDMWHEVGYDDEGSWEDDRYTYSMDITIKEPGKYYFTVSADRSAGVDSNITFKVVKERGSNVLFLTFGFLALFATAVSYMYRSKTVNGEKVNNSKHMMLIGVLVVFFIGAIIYSSRGWGYMGYQGYHSGPSFFYMGGPRIYNQPSVRDGSISGSGQRGGGFSGGK